MATKTLPRLTPVTKVTETPRPPCLCGCGGTPKGKKARYLPGHDARHHAAQKRERLDRFGANTDDMVWVSDDAVARPSPSEANEAPKRPKRASRGRAVKDGATERRGSDA